MNDDVTVTTKRDERTNKQNLNPIDQARPPGRAGSQAGI